MKTFEQFLQQPITLPVTTGWYLSDLGEARGKQELFTRQAPQKLKVLREHALIESAVSSNRIEGVEIADARIGTVLFGRNQPRDRDEEEIRGYRDALKLIHEQGANLPLTTEVIWQLHRLSRGTIWDAGKFKDEDGEILERYPDGRSRVRFKPVSAALTPEWTATLVADWQRCLRDRQVPGLIALAAFNLDFLCIHPFRDGNGRVSRLLWLLQAYHLGYEVGRYISLERLIEQNKERYYETLEQSSHRWHEGQHDPWPFINYVLYIFKLAYQEFEQRVEQTASPKGAKTELIENAIAATTRPFTITDLERACPGVSRDMIRQVLRKLKDAGTVESLGRGPGAQWQKRGSTPKKR
jgi:Fic family protein